MNRKKLFFTGAIGNSIEVFEAIVYAFLQPFITKTFFPVNLREHNLLFLLTAILPFLARPMGALFFGMMGDLKGRKTVLEYSMILSGLSCCAIAFTPSYATAGLLSFFLILFFRFLFGLAMSGEYNNSFLYLAEHSAPKSRGYILSWAAFGVSFGIFLATTFSYTFTYLIDKDVIPMWSFRLVFLLSGLSLYIAYVARKDLSETAEFFISFPTFEEKKKTAIYQGAKQELKSSLFSSIKIILLSGFGTHITYSLLFYGAFHITRYNINAHSFKDVTLLIAISSCISAMLIPTIGKITDFIGRKLLLICSLIVLTSLYLFFFFDIAKNGTYQELLCYYLALGFFNAIYFCAAPAEIIDSLPKKMRSTVNGLLYGIPALIFGALSLPYFQAQIEKYPESPLFIFSIAIPLLLFFLFSKNKFLAPSHKYMYSLEKNKVS